MEFLKDTVAVILAGGRGTRFGSQTTDIPKPLIKIGDKPIIWHIMKMYSYYGINNFIICSGYLQQEIKKYFMNMYLESGDIQINVVTGEYLYSSTLCKEPWNIKIIDTGLDTETGGRFGRIKKYVKDEPFFCATYGDSLTNVNIADSIKFHLRHKKQATVCVHDLPGRFGELKVDNKSMISDYTEKPSHTGSNINAGFYVLNPSVLDLVEGDDCVWERGPLPQLVKLNQLAGFHYGGFWHPMDSEGDRVNLNNMWVTKKAPWKVW